MPAKHPKVLRKTRARVNHKCAYCGENIHLGEYHYKETLNDRFLQSLRTRDFCTNCYEQFGESLLTIMSKRKSIQDNESKKLSDFV